MKYDNYISRKSHFLKSFERSIARSKHVLITRYGNEQTNALISESRREYETIIPHIPFIGNKSPFLIFLLPTSRSLAIYRVLQRMGHSVDETAQIIYKMNKAELIAIPVLIRRIIGYLWFSPLFLKRLRKRAKESQERKYPGGYVLTFIEGDHQTFDYGFDYTECSGCKFLNQQGVPELAPFLCAFDKATSEILGWGLTRTMTIAEGFDKCDFRFKKGGKTNITIPKCIQEIDET
jgi:hypothetical protein